MKYMLLIYDGEETRQTMAAELGKEIMTKWMAFDADIRKTTTVIDGAPLESTLTATTLRSSNGQTITSDGPFAETKEQLGGYYVVDANNLDEVTDMARKMPNLSVGGSVEIRPVMEM